MFVGAHNTLKTYSLYGAPYSDPAEGDIIVETDALAAGRYVCSIVISTVDLTDSRALFQIQRRDSYDTANQVTDSPLEAIPVVVPFDASRTFEIAYDLDEGESIAVVAGETYEGTAYASIQYQRVK